MVADSTGGTVAGDTAYIRRYVVVVARSAVDVVTAADVWVPTTYTNYPLVYEDSVEEVVRSCARAGCRREAVARGFYGGALRDLCQLCKAIADRRGGRRYERHEVQQELVVARRRVRHMRRKRRAGGDQRLLHELRRLPEEGGRGAGGERRKYEWRGGRR